MGTLGSALNTVNYTYGDSSWGDLLTEYDGAEIDYDEIGNITKIGSWGFQWGSGRELKAVLGDDFTDIYLYDSGGTRYMKTVSGKMYRYAYNGDKLTYMATSGVVAYFVYDASGTPKTVTYNDTVYYYVTNLQGDVTAILDSSGTAVVQYTYDSWGNALTITGTLADTLGANNPLRYRGYVYDTETGLYYLQSRYDNPTIGRFLNADAFTSTGQGLLGNNMFVYCNNNPTNYFDPDGHVLLRVCITDDPTFEMFFGSGGGGGGGGSAYAFSAASSGAKYVKKIKEYVDNPSENVTQWRLKADGVAFYKGVPVFIADLPYEGTAFSFGVIVMDITYENSKVESFAQTLNHEYGHYKHLQTIGPVAYATTVAVPSLTFAAIDGANIPNISQVVHENYFNLPWERIADYLGGVDRGYAPGADTAGSLYWVYTVIISGTT